MKKILLSIMLISMLITPLAIKANPTQASMNGASGLIAIPSAEVLKEKTILVGSWMFLGDHDTAFAPRVLLSFFPRWEIGAGIDIVPDMDTSAIFNTKVKIYKSSNIDIALGFNYQINATGKDTDANHNQQPFVAFTWYGWGKTSMFFGKTFGKHTRGRHIDFGIGLEKEVFVGSFGGLEVIFDFTNCGYRFLAPSYAGSTNRGIFNGGVRFLAFNKKLNIDLIAVDFLDAIFDNFAISASYQLSF